LEYLQVNPLAQVVQPANPIPPHWAYCAEVQPLGLEVVVVVAGAEVVVVMVVGWVVVVAMVVVPLPDPLINFAVTTAWEGMETVRAPPERVAEVETKLPLLLVSQAEAEPAVKPLKESLADWAELPLLVKTTTTLPSVFWKAPMRTLEIDPEVATRKAPGRMYRDHIAKAQKIPEGVAVEPLSVSTRWEPD